MTPIRLFIAIIPLSWTLAAAPALKNAGHWSYQPPDLPKVPAVTDSNWVSNPIDHFIARKLSAAGLKPNQPADRGTLIRRLTFDLHGLPPTPEEIRRFEYDNSEFATESVIWRLLRSPRYGERWARHWLDVARFSESQGYERDKIRPDAWHYRDYVINSFNQNKPYDRFVREQIAGDVIEPVTREGIKATGFLIAGPYDEVGNGQKSQVMRQRVREEDLEDIISAVGQTFRGLTINCARCHDHKFDPIPQTDYYHVKAVFEGVFHGTRTYLPPAEIADRKRRQSEYEKEFDRLNEELQSHLDLARDKLLQSRGNTNAPPTPLSQWTFDGNARDRYRLHNGALQKGAKIKNGRLILDGKKAYVQTFPLKQDIGEKTLEAWVYLPDLSTRGGGAITLEATDAYAFDSITFGERKEQQWIAGSEYFKRTHDLPIAAESDSKGLIHMAIVYAKDNHISVYRNGELALRYRGGKPLQKYHAQKAFLYFGRRHLRAGGYLKGEIEEVRLYDRALSGAEVKHSQETGPDLHTREELLAALPPKSALAVRNLSGKIARLEKDIYDASQRPLTYAANSRKPQPTHFLARGEVTAKKEVMKPQGLRAIGVLNPDFGLSATAPDPERRFHFANWLTHEDNPLLARVMVNRVWHYHFGRGLVDSPSDFGVSGSRPSHPELLDWLALRFTRDGWSLKHLHALILSSATYRQDSAFSAQGAAADADNRLLWRFTPKRLEAEAVRDSILALSGQLNLKGGGPGYRPFDLRIDNTHFYTARDKTGPEFNRRTVYRLGVQSLREPLLDTLDCPDLSTKTPVRGVTTTPLQALALMNDSFVQRQAAHMAERLTADFPTAPGQAVIRAYHLVFGRSPNLGEIRRAKRHIQDHGLNQLCWVLFNANEFIYVR